VKILCSAVLSIEAIVVFLGVVVAGTNGADDNKTMILILGFVLMILLFLAVGTLRRSWGLTAGWILQILVLAIGFQVPLMFFVGGIFVVLWYVAIQEGSKVDALKAQRAKSIPPVG
jgi:membrane protein implicated in regulation of membrane protease activity